MTGPMNPVLLFEDNHCLALNKPAGMPTQGDESGDLSLVDWVREDLRLRHHKPGNVVVGLGLKSSIGNASVRISAKKRQTSPMDEVVD